MWTPAETTCLSEPTNHILVRHYALDLSVLLQEQLIRGSVVLFLEPCPAGAGAEATVKVGATGDSETVAETGETSGTGSVNPPSDLVSTAKKRNHSTVTDQLLLGERESG